MAIETDTSLERYVNEEVMQDFDLKKRLLGLTPEEEAFYYTVQILLLNYEEWKKRQI